MKMRYLILATLVAFSFSAFAQSKKASGKKEKESEQEEIVEDDENMVPNGSFEKLADVKALKGFNLLKEQSAPWETPNATSADLFSLDAKSTKCAVPKNDYGFQAPLDGKNYAGFRAYNKDPKKTRTYLQIKLKQRLTKDAIYCVKFNVSLADWSKNGSNNVGMFLSDRKVQNADDASLSFTPQITEKTGKAIVMMDGWETICGTYIANGKEEYIIIGGFGGEDKVKLEKVKKPAGLDGGIVLNEAYYYIDMVEIKEVEAASKCVCGKADARQPDLIYSKASIANPDLKPAQILDNSAVYFALFSNEVPAMFETEIATAANIMKENPALKITLQGHCDAEEAAEAKVKPLYKDLALRRAENVKKALVAAGIEEARIKVETKDNSMPATDRTTPLGKAQNRRVEFVLN